MLSLRRIHTQFTIGSYTVVNIQKELTMVRHVVYRIVAGLVLLAALAGIAFLAYQAGVNHAAAANIQLPEAGTGLPYYPFYGMHPFFGLGLFGFLFALFLLCLAFGSMRRLIWGPRWWGWRHMAGHGPEGFEPKGHGPWGEGFPPMFAEWHRRAHAAPSGEETPAGKKPEA